MKRLGSSKNSYGGVVEPNGDDQSYGQEILPGGSKRIKMHHRET